MHWKDYEKEIYDSLVNLYPESNIEFDVKIKGRYSKEDRQIDVLVEGNLAGVKIKLILDAKCYNKNIDVKDVESFIAMAEDVGADQAIMVTTKGYSNAAKNRAYHGPRRIELDVLSFDELQRFQGPGALIYSGKHGAFILTPFGWIIDGTRRDFAIATLYQRGKTFEEGVKQNEWAYIQIAPYGKKFSCLNDLVMFHEKETMLANPEAILEYEKSVKRFDNNPTLIRKIKRKEIDLEEYTGFVDFGTHCIFCVLFTPEEMHIKNLRKLEFLIERLLPINVNSQSIAATNINSLEKRLQETDNHQQKAEISIQIGNIYRQNDDLTNAVKYYTKSISYFSENYGAKLALLELQFKTSERDALIESFYLLDAKNQTILDEIIRIGLENNDSIAIEGFLKKMYSNYKDAEILANISFALGNLYYSLDDNNNALSHFSNALEEFKLLNDELHPALPVLSDIIAQLKELK